MKELLRANDRQIHHLIALNKALIVAKGVEQILESHSNSTPTIEIDDPEVPKLIIDAAEFFSILHGAAKGHYNELAYPLIARANQGKVEYYRGTDKKMRKLALRIIKDAKMAQFERQMA